MHIIVIFIPALSTKFANFALFLLKTSDVSDKLQRQSDGIKDSDKTFIRAICINAGAALKD